MEPAPAPAGWHPDPYGRYEFRYFNGQRWTSDVSVHGQRFVDPGPPPMMPPGRVQPGSAQQGFAPEGSWPPGWAPQLPGDRPPSRGFAVAAFWVGLSSFVFGWVPFVFVLAALGAITALVFGLLALGRVRSGQGTGRGFAIAGLVLGVAALGACVAGLAFTRAVVRELDAYLDVGEHQAQIDTCTVTDGLVRADGSITNQDTVERTYTIVIGYRSGSELLDSDQVSVPLVAAGETATFHGSAFVSGEPVVTCVIESVSGPLPFDATG